MGHTAVLASSGFLNENICRTSSGGNACELVSFSAIHSALLHTNIEDYVSENATAPIWLHFGIKAKLGDFERGYMSSLPQAEVN